FRGVALPAWVAVTRVNPAQAVVRTGGRVVEFAAPPPGRLPHLDGAQDLAWPGDGSQNGRPAIRDADLVNQNQLFRVLFDHADFDGDGVLTRDEYRRYLKLQESTAGFPVVVATSTRPVDLFKLLDE